MSQLAAQPQDSVILGTDIDVELRNVFKVFNTETVVHGIDLKIRRGEFFSVLGPSGCGKTTTLRLIAGFDSPSNGDVLIRGQSMAKVPPYRRPVNTVFQSYALFNHLTIWENVAFGLRIQKLRRADVQDRVREALQLVKMESFANRYPSQLSGGQQQRVALARALVNRPAVLLLDEPLGALDLKLRKEMQVELSNLHRELGLTFVMVTHDQEEALSLSDRIAVMHAGKVEQIGTPTEIYDSPQTPFVADFIGDTNLFQGDLEYLAANECSVITGAGLRIRVRPLTASPSDETVTSNRMVVSVRPEKIKLSLSPVSSQPGSGSINCVEGRVRNVMYMGTHVHYLMELQTGDRLTVRQPNELTTLPEADTPVYAYWAAADCLALNV